MTPEERAYRVGRAVGYWAVFVALGLVLGLLVVIVTP